MSDEAYLEVITISTMDSETDQMVLFPVVGERIRPGLLITPGLSGGQLVGDWAITHAASGRCLAAGGMCMACVRRAISILPLTEIDWTLSHDAIKTEYPDQILNVALRYRDEFLRRCNGSDCIPQAVTG